MQLRSAPARATSAGIPAFLGRGTVTGRHPPRRLMLLRQSAEPYPRSRISSTPPLRTLYARVVHEGVRSDVKRASKNAYQRFLAAAESACQLIQCSPRFDAVEQSLFNSLGRLRALRLRRRRTVVVNGSPQQALQLCGRFGRRHAWQSCRQLQVLGEQHALAKHTDVAEEAGERSAPHRTITAGGNAACRSARCCKCCVARQTAKCCRASNLES